MILNQEQITEFREAAKPLVEWLNENCHPHVIVIVDPGRAMLTEGVCSQPIEEYWKD